MFKNNLLQLDMMFAIFPTSKLQRCISKTFLNTLYMKKWFGQFDIFTIFLLLIVFQIPNKKEIKHSSTTHWPNISNPLPACVSHKAFTSLKMWHTETWKPNLARSGKKSGPIQLASSWAKIVTSHTQNLSDGTMMTTVTELTNRRILFCCGSGRPTSPWKAFHSAKVSRHCFPVVPHRTPTGLVNTG